MEDWNAFVLEVLPKLQVDLLQDDFDYSHYPLDPWLIYRVVIMHLAYERGKAPIHISFHIEKTALGENVDALVRCVRFKEYKEQHRDQIILRE